MKAFEPSSWAAPAVGPKISRPRSRNRSTTPATSGYPGDYAKGEVIEGLAEAAALDGKVFHAGTALKDGQVVTSGGRVLCATAIGESVSAAQQQAYRLAEKIRWNGCFYRKDIGYRAIARERGES